MWTVRDHSHNIQVSLSPPDLPLPSSRWRKYHNKHKLLTAYFRFVVFAEFAGPGVTSPHELHQDRSPHHHPASHLLHHQVWWNTWKFNLEIILQLCQVPASILQQPKFPGDLPLPLVDVSLNVIHSNFLSYSQVKTLEICFYWIRLSPLFYICF